MLLDKLTVEVELTQSDPHTILLGYQIGSAQLDDGRELKIIGSGKTIEFRVVNKETGKMIKSYDLDLMPIAVAVVHGGV